jgi:hypothetical protein
MKSTLRIIALIMLLLIIPGPRKSIYGLLGNSPIIQLIAGVIISAVLAFSLANTRRNLFIWFVICFGIVLLNVLSEHVL